MTPLCSRRTHNPIIITQRQHKGTPDRLARATTSVHRKLQAVDHHGSLTVMRVLLRVLDEDIAWTQGIFEDMT